MGLSEIRSSIERDSKKYYELERQKALSEQKIALEEAKKRSDEILSNAKDEAKKIFSRTLAEADAEIQVECNSMLALAMDSVVSGNLPHFRTLAIKELFSKHERKIILDAISSFAEVADIATSTAEGKKKALELAKGFGKKANSSIDGILLYDKEGGITLNASIDGIVDAKLESLKSIISRNLFDS